MKTPVSAWPLVIGAALAALLTLVFVQTHTIDLAHHHRVSEALREMKHLDATLNQDVLEISLGMLAHYDSLVQGVTRLRALHGGLTSGAFAIQGDEIEASLKAFEQMLDRKELVLEQFKSENALLKNSLGYLQLASSELAAAQDPAQPRAAQLIGTLHDLMRTTLMYSFTANRELEVTTRLRIEDLKALRARHPRLVAASIDNLVLHAEQVIKQKLEVDVVLAELSALPSAARVDALASAYQAHHARALRSSNVYRFYLYGLAVALLSFIAYILVRLQRSNAGLQRKAAEQHSLAEVGRLLASSLSLRDVLDRLAEITQSLLGTDVVRIWLSDEGTGGMLLHSQVGAMRSNAAQLHRFAPREGLTGWVMTERRPLVLNTVLGDARLKNRAWFEAEGIVSFLGVPLLLDGAPVGVLACMSRHRRDWSGDEIALGEALAVPGGVAIRNAQLHEETELRLSHTKALLGVAESVTGSLDLVETMRRVAREATRLLGADSAVFYTVDHATRQVTPTAGYRIPPRVMQHSRSYDVAELPHVTASLERREMLFLEDAAGHPQYGTPRMVEMNPRSLLACPVHLNDEGLGALVLYWWDSRRELTAADRQLTAALTAQAALALQNARLFASTQAQATALMQKNVELDSFTYSVSHDLKAPLVTIQGMAGILVQDYGPKLDDDARHYLGRIEANTQQMERLIMDLLALSRVGREARAPEPVHLVELVEELLDDLAEPIRARGVKVTVQSTAVLWAVRVQMEQVMANLLGNALKYLGDAETPAVEIGSIDRGEMVEVYVRDNGIGIEPAYHEKVFEIFQRLKEVETEGTGVGLPIVKKSVEGAGGRIWVESAKGQGATFRFTWPKPRGNHHGSS